MLDCERIFGFRLLSLARGETQPLPGFEENEYALVAGHDLVPAAELLDEFELVRRGHLAMMHRFDDLAWARMGSVNGHPTVARAVPFIMIGHVRHHLAVLVSKYGELH